MEKKWKEPEKARCRACGLEIIFTSQDDLAQHLIDCPLRRVESFFDIPVEAKTLIQCKCGEELHDLSAIETHSEVCPAGFGEGGEQVCSNVKLLGERKG